WGRIIEHVRCLDDGPCVPVHGVDAQAPCPIRYGRTKAKRIRACADSGAGGRRRSRTHGPPAIPVPPLVTLEVARAFGAAVTSGPRTVPVHVPSYVCSRCQADQVLRLNLVRRHVVAETHGSAPATR